MVSCCCVLLVLLTVVNWAVLGQAQTFSGEISHPNRQTCWAVQASGRVNLVECQRRLNTDQQFEFEPMGEHLYRIKTKGDGLCLTIEGGSNAYRAPLIQMPCDDVSLPLFQQWQITGIRAGDGTRAIIPAHVGSRQRCMRVRGNALAQHYCDNNPARWIIDADLHPNDLDQLVGRSGPIQRRNRNVCCHIRTSGNEIVTRPCKGNLRQEFVFTKIPTVDRYTIRADWSDGCLSAVPTIRDGRRQIVQSEDCDAWEVRPDERIENVRFPGQCIGFGTYPRTDSTTLSIVPCAGAERWTIRGELPVDAPASIWEGPYILRQDANTDPIIAAAAANLKNGNILIWSSAKLDDYQKTSPALGRTEFAVFDPTTTGVVQSTVQITNHDMFCPGTAVLTDGRIMVTGGSISNATSIYHPDTDVWTTGDTMNRPRGYHAMTVLGDGSVMTVGGSWKGQGIKYGEHFIGGQWQPREGINPVSSGMNTDDTGGMFRGDNHMWLFTAPNGLVFHAGPAKRMHWIDVTGPRGSVTNSILRDNDDDAMNGNAVMYDIGKILTVGGAPNYGGYHLASRRSYVIDINGGIGEETAKRVGNMRYPRSFANSVILPNGKVVVVGGMVEAMGFSDEKSIMHAEMWDPQTEQWTVLGEMQIPRNYHSVALLMRDGRVFVSGGGLCGCSANHFDAEIFTPPYLVNNSGNPITNRPTINSVNQDENISPGDTLVVTMGGGHNGFTFAIVRLGAATHAVNNDNRRISLEVSSITENRYSLAIPGNSNVVLPGTYYLFAMNREGVPSEGVPVSINPS